MQFTHWQTPEHCKSVNPIEPRSFKMFIIFGVWILLLINCCLDVNGIMQLTFVIIILNCSLPILIVVTQKSLFCIKLQLFHPTEMMLVWKHNSSLLLHLSCSTAYMLFMHEVWNSINRICGLLLQWAIAGKRKNSTNVKLVILIKNYINE